MWPVIVSAVDPWAWVALAGAGALLAGLGWAPVGTRADASTGELWAANFRKAAWCLLFVVPMLLAVVLLTGRRLGVGEAAHAWLVSQAWRYAPGVLAAWMGALALRILCLRYLGPFVSAWLRRMRVEQQTDRKTDIREEIARFESRTFDPDLQTDLTKGVLMGQDASGQPNYLPWDVMLETHMQVIGPTRYGKGVLLGNVLRQCIRRGMGVWYFAPKRDEHLPYILAEEAKAKGLKFYVLDLIEGIGTYSPFAGGTAEERASRVITAFRLEAVGGSADFYKRTERSLLRKVFDQLAGTNTTLETIRAGFVRAKMEKFAGNEKRATDTTSIEDGLEEWKCAVGITGKPTPQSLNVERAINEKWVVYVRCKTMGITRDIARCLLHELTETVLRVEPKQQGNHIVAGLDEARSLFSNVVVDALTTVAGAGMTLIPAYQSVLDVRNIDDERLDKQVVEAAVNVNCQTKVVHGCRDYETAATVSLLTGTKRVLARTESAEVGAFGGERWSNERGFREDEDQLFSANTVSALPKRVAIFLAPNEVAKLNWTCWAKYDKAAFDAVVSSAQGGP